MAVDWPGKRSYCLSRLSSFIYRHSVFGYEARQLLLTLDPGWGLCYRLAVRVSISAPEHFFLKLSVTYFGPLFPLSIRRVSWYLYNIFSQLKQIVIK